VHNLLDVAVINAPNHREFLLKTSIPVGNEKSGGGKECNQEEN
jgi:hypothetical protein